MSVVNRARMALARTATPFRIRMEPQTRTIHGMEIYLSALQKSPEEKYITGERVYPDIPQFKSKAEKERAKLFDEMKNLKTVEEKIYYLNKPKYYGWYSCQIYPGDAKYGNLDFAKFATWTHVVDTDQLPGAVNTLEDKARAYAKSLAPKLSRCFQDLSAEALAIDIPNDRAPYQERHSYPLCVSTRTSVTKRRLHVLNRLNRYIMHEVLDDAPYLRSVHVDNDRRNEGFWFRAGIDPDKSMIKKKRGLKRMQEHPTRYIYFNKDKPMTEEDIYERYERPMQVHDKILLQLRHTRAITPFVPREDPLCHQYDKLPVVRHDPRTYGYKMNCQHGVNSPGHWACSESRHSNLLIMDNYTRRDHKEILLDEKYQTRHQLLTSRAIFSSFASLLAQSMMFGASPFNDPERSLAAQACLTDGHKWKLSCFQLNKTALAVDPNEDDLNNICWMLPEDELYSLETFRVNENLLAKIIALYLNEPVDVHEDCGVVSRDVKCDYTREYFFDRFRYLCSRRDGRMFEKPEIQNYQKVLMIDNPELGHHLPFMRERPWFKMAKICHRGKEIWHPEFKPLDHYNPPSIPRAFRPKGSRQSRLKKITVPLPSEEED